MTIRNQRLFSDLAIPPGENLAEELDARGMTMQELAKALGVSDGFVAEIIRGERPITDDTAAGLETAFGIRAGFWTGLEANYQETLARLREREESVV